MGKTRNSEALSYSDSVVISARVVNQLRAQYSRLTPAVAASGGRRPVVLVTINDPLPSADTASRSGTLVAGSSTAGASDRLRADSKSKTYFRMWQTSTH